MDAINDIPGDTWTLGEHLIFAGRSRFIAISKINTGPPNLPDQIGRWALNRGPYTHGLTSMRRRRSDGGKALITRSKLTITKSGDAWSL